MNKVLEDMLRHHIDSQLPFNQCPVPTFFSHAEVFVLLSVCSVFACEPEMCFA